MCETLTYLLDNIFIRFSTELDRQIIGIPMGTNSAPLIPGLFLICYERDFIASLSYNKEAEIIQAFKSRKENPQKPTQLSSRSHPRHLVGKRTAQKTPS